jgi:steroid delta-isomerase-like uncharacterized protein
MNAEQMKDVIRRSVDAFWNTGNVEIMPQIYHADYQGHDPSGMHAGDLAQFTATAKAVFAAFSDVKVVIHDLLVDGDKVTKRWTATSTHTGEFMGIPASGNQVEFTGINIYRIADGKIIEAWSNSDTLTFMQGIGAVPKMG